MKRCVLAFSLIVIAILSLWGTWRPLDVWAQTHIFPALDTNNVYTGNNTFTGQFSAVAGGAISGTYSGNPAFSGNPNFTGSPVFIGSGNTGALNAGLGILAAINHFSVLQTYPDINNVIYIDGTIYPCSGIGLNQAISAVGAKGIVDARGCNPGLTTFNTSTVAIPANVMVSLGPYTYICGVSGAPCFSLLGQGARLVGSALGRNVGNSATVGGPGWPASQSGTIIRMNTSLISSTTDGIDINPNPTPYNEQGGFEVGYVTIDFNNAGSAYGQYCVAGYAFSASHLHDIACFNPGVNGFEFETTNGGWIYDDTADHLYARQVPRIAFNWTEVNSVGFADLDRWTCNDCYYNPSDGNSANYMGTIGFHLESGPDATSGLDDFYCNNCWTGGGAAGGTNNGIQLDQTGSGIMENINWSGEVESLGSQGNYAIQANSTTPTLIVGVHIEGLQYNWLHTHNFSPSNVNGYTSRGYDSSLNTVQGLLIPQTALPSATGCPTANNNNLNGLTFPTSNGCYQFVSGTDGILRVYRLDTGPTEIWRFDYPNHRFDPASDNDGALGIPSNRWASISAVQLNIASTASLTTGGGTSDNVTVLGATASSHCALTATNSSAASNFATTYVSAKTTNQITVTHTTTAGMTYDVVCTGN